MDATTHQFRPLNPESQLALTGAKAGIVANLPSDRVDRSRVLVDCVVQAEVRHAEREVARRQDMSTEYVLPEAPILRLEAGLVEPRMAVALTAGGQFLPETLRNRRQAEEQGFQFLEDGSVVVPEAPIVDHAEPLVLVGLPTGRNYFHWMIEAVGRLLIADSVTPRPFRILTQRLSQFERECLSLAGAGADRIVQMPEDAMVRATALYVAPRGLKGAASLRREVVEALRGLAPPGETRERRVFISRAGTRRRRIRNEDAVANALTGYGFEVVHAEQLSVAEQAELFATAAAVVSLHGAGLTNLAFCRPECLVLELQPPALDDARVVLFWNLAAVQDLRYVQIVCAQAPGDAATPDSARDVEVDLAVLTQVLDEHLSRVR
jgi:capsular polysaccharide biosynthesis protein